MHRLLLAFRSFWSVLTDAAVAKSIDVILSGRKEVESAEDRPLPAGAVQLLALLQREGRFIDFLNESIDGYSDDQIGAAARDIHRGCRKVLQDYTAIQPIVEREEGARMEVPAGFDPAEIRLTGNVHGDPPFHGTLKHHGWIANSIKLPDLAAIHPRVVAPAEVEV